MLARKRCRSVAAHSNILGVGARGHHPTTARRSDAVCDLRASAGFVPFETRTPQTNRPPGPKGGRRGSVAILKTFLFLRRIANRCYRRVVSCFRCCFVFPSVGLVWIWMVFFPPLRARGNPDSPPPRGWPNLLRGRSLAVRVGNFFQGCSTMKDGLCLMVHMGDI